MKINTEEFTGVTGGFNAETEEYLEETFEQNESLSESTKSLKVVKENSFNETLFETNTGKLHLLKLERKYFSLHLRILWY